MKKCLFIWMSLLLTAVLTACGGAPAEVDAPSETTDLLEVADSVRPLPESDEPSVTYDTDESGFWDDDDWTTLDGEPDATESDELSVDGSYTTKEDVALYLHLYQRLPGNFITKKQAQALGWTGGSLEPYAPGKCIGGDYFGNYEGLLPADKNYRECDIDTLGANSRGAKRLVYSADGAIYYTDDHYNTFTLLYGDA